MSTHVDAFLLRCSERYAQKKWDSYCVLMNVQTKFDFRDSYVSEHPHTHWYYIRIRTDAKAHCSWPDAPFFLKLHQIILTIGWECSFWRIDLRIDRTQKNAFIRRRILSAPMSHEKQWDISSLSMHPINLLLCMNEIVVTSINWNDFDLTNIFSCLTFHILHTVNEN